MYVCSMGTMMNEKQNSSCGELEFRRESHNTIQTRNNVMWDN